MITVESSVDWRTRGNCSDLADPDFMYPEDGYGQKAAAIESAKWVCQGCPVAWDCLTEAMEHQDWYGVRAGLTGEYRRKHRSTPVERLLYLAGFTRSGVSGSSRASNRVAGHESPAEHHDTVMTLLGGTPRPTYWQVAERIGSTEAAVKAYWRRHREET